jgi:TetR/AcrR family transcriptional regulator
MADVRSKSRIGEANIEKILDAALSIFSRYGLRGARTDQIAEAAGMSKPNLLYYFRTKEELYVAVLERTLERWLDPLAGIDPDASPADALADYITRKLASARSHPEQSRLFATEIIQGAPMLRAALERDLAPLVRIKVDTIRRWIEAGKLAPVDPVAVLFMIWATTQHYADFAAQVEVLTGASLDDEAFFERTRDSVVSVILAGLLPRP